MSGSMQDSEEDRMLRESTRGFLAEHCSFERRRGGVPAVGAWQGMAELGWFSLAVPEADGGLGGTTRQVLAIMEEAGRALAIEPLLANLLAAPRILSLLPAGDADRFMAGAIRFAWVDGDGRGRPIELWDGGLTGTSGIALGAGDATHWLVAADGALVCLPDHTAGCARETVRPLDGSAGLRVRFDNARGGQMLARGEAATPLLDDIRDRMAAGAVADGFGAAQAGFALTLDYLKQRRQFGQALSSLQAVQHMMADAFCDLEQLRSLLIRLTGALDGPVSARERAVSAAKSFLAGRGTQAVETCIQLSGGIGVTQDYKLGHCYKRVLLWNALFGDADTHLNRLAAIDRPALQDAQA